MTGSYPWLDGKTGVSRVRAILNAVAGTYSDQSGIPHEPYLDVLAAVALLAEMIPWGDDRVVSRGDLYIVMAFARAAEQVGHANGAEAAALGRVQAAVDAPNDGPPATAGGGA